jgi:general secretion pathway protein D
MGASGGTQSGGSGSDGSTAGIKIESTDEVKFWDDLDKEFQTILNRPNDSYKAMAPIINKNAGLVTVTATAKQLERLSSYLKKLQDKVQLQVLIDVQLLSVTMDQAKSTGIDWRQLYALQSIELSVHHLESQGVSEFTQGTNGAEITTMQLGADAVHGIGSLVSFKAGGSLNEVIKFLKTQGDVSSISNPKVLTLNNQPALITAGTEFFYKLTSTETLAGGTGAGAQSANENVQSVFSGVLLSITPEIADDKTITLKINPSLSETTTTTTAQDNTGRTMPPDLNRRQLSSVVTVKDGNRIILGGLITTKSSKDSNKIPLLGDIPLISYLFKYEENVKQIQELVIIIEPHIIHKDVKSISLAELGYDALAQKESSKEKEDSEIALDLNSSTEK